MFATITPTRLTECEAAFLALIGDDPHHVGCPVMKDPGDRKHRHGLVHNAIEAMAATDRSRVLRLITQRRDPGTITVAVQDSGPGIDPKELDKMFEAFVTTKTHGIGLGLAICRPGGRAPGQTRGDKVYRIQSTRRNLHLRRMSRSPDRPVTSTASTVRHPARLCRSAPCHDNADIQ